MASNCTFTDCPCKTSISPITDVVYGKDHPRKRPQFSSTRPPDHRVGRVADALDFKTLKRIARKFPRCRKYVPKEAA